MNQTGPKKQRTDIESSSMVNFNGTERTNKLSHMQNAVQPTSDESSLFFQH
jgi:hypothetical protein